jgi:hypothetical protein
MRCLSNVLIVSWCLSFNLLTASPAATAADARHDASLVSASSSLPDKAQVNGVARTPLASAPEPVAERFGELPLSFEANRGQTDRQVRFLSRGSGYSFFLARAGAVLTFARDARSDATVLRMRLAGANPNARIEGQGELPGKNNYFVGSDSSRWRTDVPTYSRVAYESIYPGISLIYYGNQRQLEYDFVVDPGADPGQIRLAVEGVETLTVDAQGNLVLHSTSGEVQLLTPRVYQQVGGHRTEIAGRWKLTAKNVAGFRLDSYDHSQPLVIDPVLMYSSFLGGSQQNGLNKIAIDAAGNAYVAGFTTSGDFPAAPSPVSTTFGNGSPSRGAFVAKINAAGTSLLYSTYLSGSVDEEATGLAVDSSGNVYVSGTTRSTDFPTRNALQSTCATQIKAGTCSSAFLTKISPTGDSLLFSTYLGGSGGESGRSLAVDASGSAYVVGVTSSVDFPVTAGAAQTKCGGACQQNAFVAKFAPSGDSLTYATYLGGSGVDDAADIAVDASGSAYAAGKTTSADFPLATPYQKSCPADATSSSGACLATAFVTKIKADGSAFTYSTYLGGSLGSQAAGIGVDSLGSAYVAGSTQSADFPVVKAFQKSCGIDKTSGACSVDAFLTKFAPSGKTLVYSTYLGGSGRDEATGLAVDAAGNAHIVGTTESADFPTVASVQSSLKGASDAFVARFSPSGSSLNFSTFHGGSATESGNAIALDAKGNVYVAGVTSSTDFPTQHPFQSSCAGACTNAFVTKMAVPLATTVTVSPASDTVEVNNTDSFTATVTPSGNVTWTLSGANCSGATCGSVSPVTTASGTPTTYTAPSTAPLGTVTLTATSTDGTTGTATITNTDFTLTMTSSSVDVAQGSSVPNTVTAAAFNSNGYTGTITPSCSGLPTGASCSFSPTTISLPGTGTSTVTVSTTASTPAGTYTITVNGTDAATVQVSHSTTFTLDVIAPPGITKAFGASSIGLTAPATTTTSLTFTVNNPNASDSLSQIGFTDTLPSGLIIATPNGLTGSCGGGTITATAGTNAVSLSAATLAASTSCNFAVNVTGTTAANAGAQNNTTGPVTSHEGGSGKAGTATIDVEAPPTIGNAFGKSSIPQGSTTSLTYTITNPSQNVLAEAGVAFTDTIPTGITPTPSTLSNSCGGTASISGQVVTLTGGSVAVNSNCMVSVTVTGTTAATSPPCTNTTGAVSSTNGGTGNTSTTTLEVVAPPNATKAFATTPPSTPPSIGLNAPATTTATLTINISNPNAGQSLSSIAFTDSLPAGLVVAATPGLTNSCGGTATATAGSSSVSLSGGSLAASAACAVSVTVTGTTAGVKNNSVTVSSTEGGTSTPATATITVVAPPSTSKAFAPMSIGLSAPATTTSKLTFTINNPNATVSLTGIGFTDTFPSGLVVAATPNVTNTCGGTVTATAGSSSVSLSGASPLAAGASCTMSVSVTASASPVIGALNNTTSAVTSNEGGSGTAATATLDVEEPPSIANAFGAAPSIALGSTTSLTYTITNPAANVLAEAGVAFTDTIPTGITPTASTLASTCGGTASISGQVVTLTGGSVAVNSNCTVSVTVTGATAGTYTNTTGAVSSTNGGTGNTATANLDVMAPPVIAEAFSLSPITVNGTSTLTFTITNPAANELALTGVGFSDTLPTGLTVPSGSSAVCGGTLTTTAPTGISLSGATIAVSGQCQFSVTVTGAAAAPAPPGMYTNTTSVSSTNGGTGNTATANITVQDYQLSLVDNIAVFIQGSSVPSAATATVTPVDGYSNTVSSTGCSPTSFNCTFANVTGGSGSPSVTISNAATTPVGFYNDLVISASGAPDNSGSTPPPPAIVHSATLTTIAVQCTLTLQQVIPTFTPAQGQTPSVTPNQYSIGTSVAQGGNACPYGNSAVNGGFTPGPVTGDGTVVTSVEPASGTASTTTPGTETFETAAAGTTAATGSVNVPYFDATQTNDQTTLSLPVTVEANAPLSAGVGPTTVNLTVTQTGTLTIPNIGTSSTVCGVLNSNGDSDSTGNNFGISCTAAQSSGVWQLTVTVSSSTPTMSSRNAPAGFVMLYALGFPAIVFVGASLSAFGPDRRRRTLKRITSSLGIFMVILLVVLLPACGGGFHANFFGTGTSSSYTLTVMGYETNASSSIQGVEIFTVPLTIVE